jgi:hypothetical protein
MHPVGRSADVGYIHRGIMWFTEVDPASRDVGRWFARLRSQSVHTVLIFDYATELP